MKALINIQAGSIDSDVLQAQTESIVEVLNASLLHHNPDVTLKALETLQDMSDVSINGTTIDSCTVTHQEDCTIDNRGVNPKDKEEKDETSM